MPGMPPKLLSVKNKYIHIACYPIHLLWELSLNKEYKKHVKSIECMPKDGLTI